MTADFHLPGASFLHRADPRAKILALVGLTACFIVPAEPLVPLCAALLMALVTGLALGRRELGRLMLTLAPVLVFIALLTPPFVREGRTLVSVLGLPLLTTGGVRTVLAYLGRFTGIALVFFALLRTMRLEELVLALRWFCCRFPRPSRSPSPSATSPSWQARGRR